MSSLYTSGSANFTIETPYHIMESGEAGEKPLIVYLHGFNQNREGFQTLVSPMLDLCAYHLFIQAPYPIYDRRRKKKVSQWGRAWYLYDGDQDQFIHSLEQASAFIENVLDKLQDTLSWQRLAIFGYSMGGYLGGYFALSRPHLVQELMVVGGRIKTEVIKKKGSRYNDLKVLALHGSKDQRVQSEPQQDSCQELSRWGAEVTFKEVVAGHRLDSTYLQVARQWLQSSGYALSPL